MVKRMVIRMVRYTATRTEKVIDMSTFIERATVNLTFMVIVLIMFAAMTIFIEVVIIRKCKNKPAYLKKNYINKIII